MKVLYVSPYFYPDGGGAEKYLYFIAKELVKHKIEITVVCSNINKDKKKEEILDGIYLYRLKPDILLSKTPIRFSLLKELYSIIKKNSFDLVTTNLSLPYYPDIGTFISKVFKIPCITIYHNDLVKEDNVANLILTLYNYSLNKLLLYLQKKIITPSIYCFYESKFLKPFKNKVVLIPPGVDIKKYKARNSSRIHRTHNISEKSKIILFVGSLGKNHMHKGVNILIKAFKDILTQIKDVYLVLVGKGDAVPYYKKMCIDIGINDKVIFAGYLDEESLIEYYQSCDCLVLPSTTVQEGFGIVLIEANACGKPVVGSNIGGIKYVIKDYENGLLVPPKDPKALAEAIIKILTDEELARKMGENGRKIVEKKYTWDRAIKMTEKVYKEVIEGEER